MNRQNRQKIRQRLFFSTHPGADWDAYKQWIQFHIREFRKSRVIRCDSIPADMQDEFTDWLQLQCLEAMRHG